MLFTVLLALEKGKLIIEAGHTSGEEYDPRENVHTTVKK